MLYRSRQIFSRFFYSLFNQIFSSIFKTIRTKLNKLMLLWTLQDYGVCHLWIPY